MATQAVDFEFPQSPASLTALHEAGVVAVGRYLAPGLPKCLTAHEAQAISAADLDIFTCFETTASRALGGAGAGQQDGLIAAALAQQAGQPNGTPIYATVDFDASPIQMSTVMAYLTAFGLACAPYLGGVYGSFMVLESAKQAGAVRFFWQSLAWSSGALPTTGTHLYQSEIDQTLAGVPVDLDQIISSLYGGWRTQQPVTILPPDIPSWAAPAVLRAMQSGIINTPAGDETWYRVQVELDRLGLFPKP
ncbi:MAG: glycoside hydrolase domain-containing protein [Actinomycetes bacterium]